MKTQKTWIDEETKKRTFGAHKQQGMIWSFNKKCSLLKHEVAKEKKFLRENLCNILL